MILRALVRKEFIELGRDPVTLAVAVLLPLVLLFLFGYGIRYDVENVALAVMQRKGMTRRFFSAATFAPDVRDEWMQILGMLGIAHVYNLPVSKLAYGQQRLLDLAIGLALTPKVLLLDEPAAGVPHDEAPKILDAINRLPPDIAVLMIDHDMDLVFRFAKRVLVMANGRLIFEGSPADVTKDDEVRRAYLGSYADASRTA